MQIKPGEKRRSDPGDRIGQHQHRKSRIEPVKRKDPDQSQDADTENHNDSGTDRVPQSPERRSKNLLKSAGEHQRQQDLELDDAPADNMGIFIEQTKSFLSEKPEEQTEGNCRKEAENRTVFDGFTDSFILFSAIILTDETDQSLTQRR